MGAGITTSATASAAGMYSAGPRGVNDPGPFGPGTVARSMVYIWVASGLWLAFVGAAAANY